MDYMIWVVAIALFAYVFYAMYTAPPSSGCLSQDLARAMDEKKKAEAARRSRRTAQPAPAAPQTVEPAPTAPQTVEPAPTESGPAEPAAAVESDMLRDPATGETCAIPTNYRFSKRWIKEALVAEGLLDKVYSNAELDAANTEKVRVALAQFRTLTKYHA